MKQAINVGIIGAGRHGARYAEHIVNDLPGLALTAISRRSAEGREQAGRWQAVWYEQWPDLVRDPNLDAVIAAATPDINPAVAALCAETGKPLLAEKPLAFDTAASVDMVACMADAGQPLTVGQTLRYNSTILALRERLHLAGRLHAFSADQRLEPSAHPWLEEPAVAGGGVILHTAVHLFDALRFITGREVERVRAVSYQRHNPNLEDLVLAILEMGNGLVGTIDAGKVGHSRSGRYEFVGEEAQLNGEQVFGTLDLVRGTKVEPLSHAEPVNTILPLLADWERHLRGEGPNPIPGEEGLAAVAVCEACARSSAEDRWVEVQRP